MYDQAENFAVSAAGIVNDDGAAIAAGATTALEGGSYASMDGGGRAIQAQERLAGFSF